MMKAAFFLNRKDDMDQAEFEDHWQEEHAPIAIDGVPGLQKYTISFPTDPEEAPYNGVAELYFEDESALQNGLDSDAMQEAVADVPNFADPNDVMQMVLEENVQVDRT